MKRGIISLLLLCALFSFNLVIAEPCDIQVSLINQDTYPAIQGDYVKLVFQVDGVENVDCKTVTFELIENYPISFDAGQEKEYTFEAGMFDKDYQSFFLAPFKVRVSEDALDGDNPIEVRYKFADNIGYETKEFSLNVQDTRADFEVHVKEYDVSENMITLEILNIAESDIEALTIEIPNQENIEIKGPSRNIVGDLDSNEYTTADFEAMNIGEEFEIILHYSDAINERRTVSQMVSFDKNSFLNRTKDIPQSNKGTYIFWGIIILVIGVWYFRRRQKKKNMHKRK